MTEKQTNTEMDKGLKKDISSKEIYKQPTSTLKDAQYISH